MLLFPAYSVLRTSPEPGQNPYARPDRSGQKNRRCSVRVHVRLVEHVHGFYSPKTRTHIHVHVAMGYSLPQLLKHMPQYARSISNRSLDLIVGGNSGSIQTSHVTSNTSFGDLELTALHYDRLGQTPLRSTTRSCSRKYKNIKLESLIFLSPQ